MLKQFLLATLLTMDLASIGLAYRCFTYFGLPLGVRVQFAHCELCNSQEIEFFVTESEEDLMSEHQRA
jgi:hypothetical protein